VCAALALLPLSLPLAQLGGSERSDPSYLAGALTGWLLYHLLSTGLATLTARHDRTVDTG
jgi:hypothetical protein